MISSLALDIEILDFVLNSGPCPLLPSPTLHPSSSSYFAILSPPPPFLGIKSCRCTSYNGAFFSWDAFFPCDPTNI